MLAGSSIIKKALADGVWTAHRDGKAIGCDDLKIGPHSIDVSLGGTFIEPKPYTSRQLAFKRERGIPTNGSTWDMGPIALLDPYIESHKQLDMEAWKTIEAEFIDLAPGGFVLASVRERFDSSKPVVFTNGANGTNQMYPFPWGLVRDLFKSWSTFHVTQCYDGRSTMGRIGIMSHVTAGYGDLGFKSNFTLELHNVNPNLAVRLHRGMRIGQISFHAIGCINEAGPDMYQGSYTEQHDRPVAPSLGVQKFMQPGERCREYGY